MSRRRLPAPAFVAEFLGTFGLVFGGPGAAAVDAASGGAVGTVGVGLAFGLVVMAMVFAFGPVSGAHINPAVTLATLIRRGITPGRAAGYVVSQLAGGVAAGLAIVLVVGQGGDAGASVPRIGGTDAALVSEIVLTFFLVAVILLVAVDPRGPGPLGAVAIGGYVGVAATAWGPVAGASLNPARSLGPAVAANVWTDHWVYWVGPLAGALLAVLAYELLRAPGAAGSSGTSDR